MKFAQALETFVRQITIQYGIDDPILKIALPVPVFDAIAMEVFSEKTKYGTASFGFQTLSDGMIINGVKLVRREKENF